MALSRGFAFAYGRVVRVAAQVSPNGLPMHYYAVLLSPWFVIATAPEYFENVTLLERMLRGILS